MRSEFRLPALGADMEHAVLVEWRVRPGDRVARGDVVAAVETDKGVIDLECFETGEVCELVASPGTRVDVGGVLALLEVEASAGPIAAARAPAPSSRPVEPSAIASATAAPPRAAAGRVRVSPAARARAHDLGIALEGIAGTGAGGAIELADVEAAAPPAAAATAPAESPAAPRDPVAAMRAAIASAMARSKREIPHYYLTLAMNLDPALAWLERHNASVEPAGRLLYPALVLKAVALAASEVPGFNGHFREGRFEPAAAVHVGVAIALRGGGLIAPAILDAAGKPLDVLMSEFRDLVSRARTARLRSSELTSPTITVTSLGDVGVEAVLPVIHPPQVAMVGAGSVLQRPWVADGAIVARPVMTLALAADHRVSDGRSGAQFLDRIRQKLGAPEAL
ncbi:MAG: 2-oxo acid dehydrogenase subunit E2 [Steroidobacteraceae bacterium]|jgi:pyruvate dehydrogenase E2 component (dihydrolipoamide acetyltransferase)|nr:2-oxo acid dehydrogenase subunit E2 [Steroidobacteraceae bacterium]